MFYKVASETIYKKGVGKWGELMEKNWFDKIWLHANYLKSYMQTKYLCVLIHIWIKGEVGAVKPV